MGIVVGHGTVKKMIDFIDYNLTEEDLDKIRLAVIRLLFDKDLLLISGVFVNELDGTQTMKIVMKPKAMEAKADD